MTGCSAFGCKNRSENGFKMKSFPKDPARRKLWALKVNRANPTNTNKIWTPTPRSRLCHVHFDDSQFEEKAAFKLKNDAVPLLFPHKPTLLKRVYVDERLKAQEVDNVKSLQEELKAAKIKIIELEKQNQQLREQMRLCRR